MKDSLLLKQTKPLNKNHQHKNSYRMVS